MSNFISPDRNTLLHPLLIKEENREQAEQIIAHAKNPIALCQSLGYTRDESFFPHLSEVLHVPYISELEVPVSAATGIALRIPPRLLLEHQIYVYEHKDVLYCAVANPYIDNSVWSEILLYIGKPSLQLVISNPIEISNALSHVYHADLTITSSEIINVIHKDKSASTYSTQLVPKIFPIGFFIFLAIALFLWPYETVIGVFIVLNIIYFVVNPYKFYAMFLSLSSSKLIKVSQESLVSLSESSLPVYTILIPLRNEVSMVPSLVEGIFALDYPNDKLDIKFICELDDAPTIQALQSFGIGIPSPHLDSHSFTTQLIKVPKTDISTKPKACDYALSFARGQFTVIYDAEDKPDKDQLKKAYIGFLQAPLDTVCIQAKLNFYNSRQNILTRFFSMEYGFWYDYYLPGLQEMYSPIPLGGTSNHFITQTLRKIGTWDPRNVTEDADLGLRIFRYKLKTFIIDSYTQEEANSRIGNWIRQRTRWQKGFLLTFLVHSSRPLQLLQELGMRQTILVFLVYGGNFFLPLFNPVLWILFVLSFTPYRGMIQLSSVPYPIYVIGVFNLLFGNITYIAIHLFAAIRNKRYDLAPLTLFLPLYWLLLSYATIRAGFQFIRNPYIWEKTTHGYAPKKLRK